MNFDENDLESTIISKLQDKGYEYGNTTDSWFEDRELNDYVNRDLLFVSLKTINPTIKDSWIDDAITSIVRISNTTLFERNRIFHNYLINGIRIETGNDESNPTIKLIDFDNVENNTFQVVNQIKFNEKGQTRIPDVIIYINGIPLVVFELKSQSIGKTHF